jgi:hypothetical protein
MYYQHHHNITTPAIHNKNDCHDSTMTRNTNKMRTTNTTGKYTITNTSKPPYLPFITDDRYASSGTITSNTNKICSTNVTCK